MIVRKTLPEENAAINRLFSVAFQTTPDKGPADADNPRICHWGAFSEEGELMSSLSLTSYSIRFDGHACPMAGVGAVQTLPPYRRADGRAASPLALPRRSRRSLPRACSSLISTPSPRPSTAVSALRAA